ncbi:hypothetical protein C2G38_2103265 [Gigaspora rosea]|uniref:Uncharacterized protein n=1 Tax=Gigaspora rosea TaxID=44941 RepID=A0A397UVN6_9GLOM|nr:hypothetical protein C2G38_2103265 [Gigaspora rosea]
MLNKHEISYKHLWYIFPNTQFFAIIGEIIDSNILAMNSTKNWYVDHYVVVPLPKESAIYNELVERGKKFEMLAIGSHYLRYSEKIFSSILKIKEEELSICSPTFFGFSFMAKKWGQFYVDQVDGKNDIITRLVKSEHSGGLDLISGKGGGCIVLLHGPPGVISEYLHRSLYAVSVGELGVTPKELENKLSEILEVASVWNAVI